MTGIVFGNLNFGKLYDTLERREAIALYPNQYGIIQIGYKELLQPNHLFVPLERISASESRGYEWTKILTTKGKIGWVNKFQFMLIKNDTKKFEEMTFKECGE